MWVLTYYTLCATVKPYKQKGGSMKHPHSESRALIALQNAAQKLKDARVEKLNAYMALSLVVQSGTEKAIELRTNEYLQAINDFARKEIAYSEAWDKYTMHGA